MKHALFLVLFLFTGSFLIAQGVKISSAGGNPDPAAILEMESSAQGFLPPRMTSTQRDQIASPAAGLTIFNTTTNCTNVFNGSAWYAYCGTCLPQPSLPAAGPDQAQVSGTSTTLAGNVPGAGSTALWTIVSGAGGSFSGSPTSTNPAASFSGTAGTSYVLRWTHTNSCGSLNDDVQVSFCPALTTPNAGSDQLNVPGTSVVLGGNTPGAGNTALWTISSGSGGSFSGASTSSQHNATFSGLAGASYTLTWTHSTACGSAGDAVVISFAPACPSTLTDIDNNVYNVIQIGAQCWTKENLRTTRYRNGASIAHPGSDNSAWLANTTGAYAWYSNNAANGSTYGALYNWAAVTSASGLCPSGWHVATDPEWTTLVTFLGGQTTAGGPMKAVTGWSAPNTGASNLSGFSAVGGGFRSGGDGNFYSIGTNGYLWTSTVNSLATTNAWGCYLASSNANATRNDGDKKNGFSVRCLRD